MEGGDVSDFVEWEQHTGEELLVLVLERQSEAVNDRAEDFEQFADAVVAVGFINETEKHVIDCRTNERT